MFVKARKLTFSKSIHETFDLWKGWEDSPGTAGLGGCLNANFQGLWSVVAGGWDSVINAPAISGGAAE